MKYAGIPVGLLAIAVFLSGCSTSRFLDGKEHGLGEIALVTDVTVLHEQSSGLPQVIVDADMHIANGLENTAAGILAKKGYQPLPVIASSGSGFFADQQPLEVFPELRFASHQAPNMPPFGMYVRSSYANLPLLVAAHRKSFDPRLVFPDRHGKPLPMLVMTARGKTENGGKPGMHMSMGSNVILSKGARDAISVEAFEKNTFILDVSLLEGGSGKLLWQASRSIKAEADIQHFVGTLETLLQDFPVARQISQ